MARAVPRVPGVAGDLLKGSKNVNTAPAAVLILLAVLSL